MSPEPSREFLPRDEIIKITKAESQVKTYRVSQNRPREKGFLCLFLGIYTLFGIFRRYKEFFHGADIFCLFMMMNFHQQVFPCDLFT